MTISPRIASTNFTFQVKMKILIYLSTFAILIAAICAAPTCSMDGNCKGKLPFHQVDCMEKLKFKHAEANCFMNDADEFLIMALHDDNISKRSIADYEAYRSPAGITPVIHRLKRSTVINRLKRNTPTEDAEVLNANDLKKLLSKAQGGMTESPATSNEVTNSITGTDADKGDENNSPVGVIIVIGFDNSDNAIEKGNDTSISGNGDEDMAEALFGLLLLGAILDEMQKHQQGGNSSDDE